MSSSNSPESLAGKIGEHEEYPALLQMIGAYFHQDYDIISEDPDVIVAEYKQESKREHVHRVIDDINRFLKNHAGNDDELAASFYRIFKPEAGFYGWKGRTVRESLLKVLEILSDDKVPTRD